VDETLYIPPSLPPNRKQGPRNLSPLPVPRCVPSFSGRRVSVSFFCRPFLPDNINESKPYCLFAPSPPPFVSTTRPRFVFFILKISDDLCMHTSSRSPGFFPRPTPDNLEWLVFSPRCRSYFNIYGSRPVSPFGVAELNLSFLSLESGAHFCTVVAVCGLLLR